MRVVFFYDFLILVAIRHGDYCLRGELSGTKPTIGATSSVTKPKLPRGLEIEHILAWPKADLYSALQKAVCSIDPYRTPGRPI